MQNHDNSKNENNYLALLLPVIDDVSTVCWRSFSDSECLTLDTVIIIHWRIQLSWPPNVWLLEGTVTQCYLLMLTN